MKVLLYLALGSASLASLHPRRAGLQPGGSKANSPTSSGRQSSVSAPRAGARGARGQTRSPTGSTPAQEALGIIRGRLEDKARATQGKAQEHRQKAKNWDIQKQANAFVAVKHAKNGNGEAMQKNLLRMRWKGGLQKIQEGNAAKQDSKAQEQQNLADKLGHAGVHTTG